MTIERSVVIVSGGSRGLGRAIVTSLREHNHIVATFSRSSTPFIEACQRADLEGETFLWQAIDGTQDELVRQFVRAVAQRYGRVDVLINNAAANVDGVLPLLRAADIRQLIAVNLEGVIFLTQACARRMLQEAGGCIINISSVVGLRGTAGASVYSATKAALDGLTRSLARELGPRGIRVNAVAPGYLETDMTDALTEEQRVRILRRTPLGRLGTVEDVTGVIRFLMSPEARFMTGQTIVVDGGLTC